MATFCTHVLNFSFFDIGALLSDWPLHRTGEPGIESPKPFRALNFKMADDYVALNMIPNNFANITGFSVQPFEKETAL